MPDVPQQLSDEEIARRGNEIYTRDVRPREEPANTGKVAAIDVLTGRYALGKDALAAADALRAREPNAEIWLVRIGSRYLHRIGSRPEGSTP
jgi:hypothetical protein